MKRTKPALYLFLLYLGNQGVFLSAQADALLNHEPVTISSTRIHKSEELPLSVQYEQAAEFWKLSLEDYLHYQSLVNQAGIQDEWKELDPPHLLGLLANTESEIQKYAEIAVKLDFERSRRELAFQEAYQQAFKKYYSGQLLFVD